MHWRLRGWSTALFWRGSQVYMWTAGPGLSLLALERHSTPQSGKLGGWNLHLGEIPGLSIPLKPCQELLKSSQMKNKSNYIKWLPLDCVCLETAKVLQWAGILESYNNSLFWRKIKTSLFFLILQLPPNKCVTAVIPGGHGKRVSAERLWEAVEAKSENVSSSRSACWGASRLNWDTEGLIRPFVVWNSHCFACKAQESSCCPKYLFFLPHWLIKLDLVRGSDVKFPSS